MAKSQPTIFGLMFLVLFWALALAYARGLSFLPLVIVAVGAYLILKVVVPYASVIIRYDETYRLSLDREYLSVDLLGPGVPEQVLVACQAASRDLEPLGFSSCGSFRPSNLPTTLPGIKPSAFVSIFQNGSTWEVARLLCTVVDRDRPPRVVSFTILISTEFEDGCEVLTSDRATPGAYPPMGPPVHAFRFPDIQDAGELLGLHRALVRRFEGGRTRRDPISGDPVDYQMRQSGRVPGHAVACGYTRLVEESTAMRSTWKGAILIALRQSRLGKAILLALMRGRARRWIRELSQAE
jgi:hypothetical protein